MSKRPILLVALSLALQSSPLLAQVPRTLSVQGMLTTSAGATVPDGNRLFAFSLYSTATGGTPLFTEVTTLAVSRGVYSFALGSTVPLPPTILFDQQYYLGTSIDGGAELTPRTTLTASPYAIHALVADVATSLAPGITGLVTSVNTLSGAIAIVGTGGTTVSSIPGLVTINSATTGGLTLPYTSLESTASTLFSATNNGAGIAILGVHGDSTGIAAGVRGESYSQDASGTAVVGVMVSTTPGGFSSAVRGMNNGTGGLGIGVYGSQGGGGWGVYGTTPSGIGVHGNSTSGFGLYGVSSSGVGIAGTSSTSSAGTFQISNNLNSAAALSATTSGSGPALSAVSMGVGGAGTFSISVPGNNSTALQVTTVGSGSAGSFAVADPTSSAVVLSTSTTGNGSAGKFSILSATNNSSAVQVSSTGLGAGVVVTLTNASNGARGIDVEQSGVGPGVYASSAGGNAVWGITASISAAGVIGDNTFGEAVVGRNRGGSGVGAVVGRNDSSGYGVRGFNTKNGYGVYGQAGISGGTGVAGHFENVNAANASDGVQVATNGTGNALLVNQTHATTGNIAVFQSATVNKARIDKTGKGFFNGGTQVGGADVAENFAVTGDRSLYAPGDVLVIAPHRTRTVQKCSRAYSRAVLGVYATKPGVLMGERDVELPTADLVPMGVVGVLPTKVCLEGGRISAGDLLVTSSRAGFAMRGDPGRTKLGMVLGKALEDYDGGDKLIAVFVNVK